MKRAARELKLAQILLEDQIKNELRKEADRIIKLIRDPNFSESIYPDAGIYRCINEIISRKK